MFNAQLIHPRTVLQLCQSDTRAVSILVLCSAGALGGGLTSFTDLAATGAASGFNFSGVKSSSDDWKPDDKPLFSRHNEIDEADDQSNELHQVFTFGCFSQT